VRRFTRLGLLLPALAALAFAVNLRGLDVGAVAPDFTMQTLDGRKFSLAEAEKSHKAVVVLFISTVCPYSNYQNDLIRDLSADFAKRGVTFVGINSGTLETTDEVRKHAREHGHTFDIIKDPEARVAELLDARRTPEAFLFDSSGTLRYHGRIASKISVPDLQKAIEALLAGKAIHPAETKAFGCAIAKR
jgi:peroxiredoxin